MIVENQENLKVHFAGAESLNTFAPLKAGGADYCLFTVFPFICGSVGIKGQSKNIKVGVSMTDLLYKNYKHCIMDSGLFTLMFGSHKGEKSEEYIEKWYAALVNFVKTTKYKGTVVEVDCQKVLGCEKAWEFRRRMKKDLPNNRQINVFHKEDGRKGLDEMIEFSDYIAISVPELRFMGQKKYVQNLAYYIKYKKPSIDIHLLGCTELGLLKKLKFCSSSDSTSWNSCVRYGDVLLRNKTKGHINNLKDSAHDIFKEKLNKYYRVINKTKPSRRDTILAFQVSELLALYSQSAGSQN